MMLSELTAFAQLAKAAYMDDKTNQAVKVHDLGYVYLDRYETTDHQAFLCNDAMGPILAISGTRFNDGNLHELLDDCDLMPISVAAGIHVAKGFWEGQDTLYEWARSHLGAASFRVTGHSLGGCRAHLAPWFLGKQIEKVVSFGAPKMANRAFWDAYKAPLVRVVHERDLWAGWPFVSEYVHPEAMVWLHNGGLQVWTESQWPGGLNPDNHAIDTGYLTALLGMAGVIESAVRT